MLHNIMMYSSSANDVKEYGRLLNKSGAEIRIIMMVASQPSILLREIGEQLHTPKSTLTSMIDRLEKQNILKRVISQRDRRSFGLELTEEGQKTYHEFISYQAAIGEKILKTLTPEEQDNFVQLLLKIVTNIVNENKG